MSIVLRFTAGANHTGFWVSDVQVLSHNFKFATGVSDVRRRRVVDQPCDDQVDKDGIYVFISDVTDYQEGLFREYISKVRKAPSGAVLITRALRVCHYFPHDLPVDFDDITVRDLYLMLSIKHKMPVNPDVAARALSA